MTKPLKSFPEGERRAVAQKRVAGKTGGLGYHSAVAYLARLGEKPKKAKAQKQEE